MTHTYSPADAAVLTGAASQLVFDCYEIALMRADAGHFWHAAKSMRVAAAAARIVAAQNQNSPSGLRFAARAAECDGAARFYEQQARASANKE